MEFLNLCLMTWTTWLLLKRPEKERLAFRLLLISLALTIFIFLVGIHSSLLPGVDL